MKLPQSAAPEREKSKLAGKNRQISFCRLPDTPFVTRVALITVLSVILWSLSCHNAYLPASRSVMKEQQHRRHTFAPEFNLKDEMVITILGLEAFVWQPVLGSLGW